MIQFLALALAFSPAALASEESPPITGAVIQEYGPMPLAGSGILMILRPVTVMTATGEKRALYFIHGAEGLYLGARHGTPYPAIGSTCDFKTQTRHIASTSYEGTSLITGDGGPDAGEVILEVTRKV